MRIEKDNPWFEGNINLLFDGLRDKPGANAANATIDKIPKDQLTQACMLCVTPV